jgi:hypothetical protein
MPLLNRHETYGELKAAIEAAPLTYLPRFCSRA